MPFFVFVAGAPGSGKTFYALKLCEEICKRHDKVTTTVVSMDNYFKSKPEDVKTAEDLDRYRKETNFDRPEMIDFDLFYKHLVSLSKGKAIERPIYCIKRLARKKETETLQPADIIIIEGIFAHVDLERSGLPKDKYVAICIETDCYLTYQARRYVRDPLERGNSLEVVRKKEIRDIRLSFWSIIRPAAQRHACLFVTNNYDPKQEPSEQTSYMKGIQEMLTLIKMKTRLDWSCESDDSELAEACRFKRDP